MKKYISYLGILVFSLFSFYYTDKACDIVKRNDPIMKQIVSNKDKYTVKPVNAIIDNNEISPGINGLEIDVNKSYEKMKKYNKYDESMFIYNEVIPNISILNKYNNYIVSGNKNKQNIALIFKINDDLYLNELNNILLNKMIVCTIFIDGSLVEENMDKLIEINDNGNEIENLGFNNSYNNKFTWTNNLIFSITKEDPKYCYTDYKNDEILKLCSNNNMYTVKPSISITNYPFISIKNNINNGSIIGLNLDKETIKELPSIISYIKQKGYNLVTVNELINEKIVE